MKRPARFGFFAGIALLASGCTASANSADAATEVANAYLKDRNQGQGRVIASRIDMGDRWRLSYELPEGSTGGPIIVVVNKRRGEVVHAETEQ